MNREDLKDFAENARRRLKAGMTQDVIDELSALEPNKSRLLLAWIVYYLDNSPGELHILLKDLECQYQAKKM